MKEKRERMCTHTHTYTHTHTHTYTHTHTASTTLGSSDYVHRMNMRANTPAQLIKKLQSIFSFKEEEVIILYRQEGSEMYDKLPSKTFPENFPLRIQILVVDN